MKLLVKDFLEICEVAKMMKSTVISFYNGDIFGYELEVVNLKQSSYLKNNEALSKSGIAFSCFNKHLQAFAKTLIVNESSEIDINEYDISTPSNVLFRLDIMNIYYPPKDIYEKYGNSAVEYYTYMADKGIFNSQPYFLTNIINIYSRLLYEMGTSKHTQYDNLREEEKFNLIISGSASEGIFRFTKDDYIMDIPGGCLPVNKADKVDLSIYDLGWMFISKFTILKKKVPINVFIRYKNVLAKS
jgi:hypothetical protein